MRLREVSADPSRVDKLAMVMHRMTKAMKHGKLKVRGVLAGARSFIGHAYQAVSTDVCFLGRAGHAS